MESFLTLVFIVILIVLLGNASAGGKDDPYLATDKEELYGTWINADYDSTWRPEQKIIYHTNGRYEKFRPVDRDIADSWGKYLITRKWSDQEGNVWYKYHCKENSLQKILESFILCKISDSGKILGSVYDFREYPTEIDPESPHYRIYFRK